MTSSDANRRGSSYRDDNLFESPFVTLQLQPLPFSAVVIVDEI
jgi:hypothetical protein